MDMAGKWKDFWQDKSAPFHAEDTDEFYDAYSAEVKAILRGSWRKTLEIGCGTGSLYPHLSGIFGEYTGVDFSERMLDGFRRKHPGLRLFCADGSAYLDDATYDLIFCNGVVQNFSPTMMKRFIQNTARMIGSGGTVFIGMIPDKRLKYEYLSGYLRKDLRARPAWTTFLRYWRDRILGRDGLGQWFDAVEFVRMAHEAGFDCRITGSLFYRYRFHAVLTRPGGREENKK